MIDEPEIAPPPEPSSEPAETTTPTRWLLPALICLASLLVFSYYARKHPYGTYTTETDFYQYYGPDAQRIGAWQFPENPYQGPGYPAMLAVVSKLSGGDLFSAGKWLSVVSAAIVGLLSYILFSRLFGYWPGVGAQLSVLVVTQLPIFAINPTTDVFFLVPCLASLVVFTSDRLAVPWRIVLTAVLIGITYLTRYNGVFLLAACLFGIVLVNIFERSWRSRLVLASVLIAIFLVTASPWLIANYKQNGSPFYNTNYLNIATEFYPDLANDNVFQDSTRSLAERFHSFGEVFRHDPGRMLKHYPENLFDCLGKTVTLNLVSQWVGWLGLAGFALALIERRSKNVTLVLTSIGFCVLLLALTHWEDRYYFYIGVMYSGLAAYAGVRVLRIVRKRGWARHRVYAAIPLILFAVMWSMAFSKSRRDLTRFLNTHPTEIVAACDYLKSENVNGARIVARKPHLPAMCGGEWIYFPQVESLDGLRVWLQKNRVDYIAFGIREQAARPQLQSLKDPSAAPPWLKPVWVSAKPPFVLYKPQ